MLKLTAAFAIAASPALADGYADHHGVLLWTKKPCTEAVGAIDAPAATVMDMGQIGMAWGWLLGYDTARGGLQGDEETTLIRLRKACAANPTATGKALLDGF